MVQRYSCKSSRPTFCQRLPQNMWMWNAGRPDLCLVQGMTGMLIDWSRMHPCCAMWGRRASHVMLATSVCQVLQASLPLGRHIMAGCRVRVLLQCGLPWCIPVPGPWMHAVHQGQGRWMHAVVFVVLGRVYLAPGPWMQAVVLVIGTMDAPCCIGISLLAATWTFVCLCLSPLLSPESCALCIAPYALCVLLLACHAH